MSSPQEVRSELEIAEAELGAEIMAQDAEVDITLPPIPSLTPEEVKQTIAFEIQDALGSYNSEIAEQRRLAIQYYNSKPFGNEQQGRSSVIMSDVQETVEWILPSLMRIFMGGRNVVNYLPQKPEDEGAAEQATDWVNHVFLRKNPGFMILHDWFKTALIEKNGFVASMVENKTEPKRVRYEDLSGMELNTLLENGVVDVLAYSERMVENGEIDPATGQPVQESRYDIDVVESKERTEIRVDGIPPEEFLIARRARILDDYTPFCGRRKKRTVSELIALGYDPDLVYSAPSDDSPEYGIEYQERRSDEEIIPGVGTERTDPASRELWTTECAIRLDEDGDGYAELRWIVVVGDTNIVILEDKEIDHNPFSSITPIPMPYKFFGHSVADLVMDLQLIRSTLFRQMLDNLYLINNTRTEVVEGQVEIDDLLTSRPGGVVRVSAPGMINPIPTGQLGPMAFHMLEYTEGLKENRTGVTRYNQGLDAASLNQTATGISKIMHAAEARIELIARIFSETGLKDLFKKILRLTVLGPMKKEVIRLRNEWVEMDPSGWNADMDVEIEVGLGVGQATERIAFLGQLLEIQQAIVQKGGMGMLVTPQNIYNAVRKLSEAMGFKLEGQFFTDPQGKMPQPPPPDPRLIAAQAKARDGEAKLQVEQQKAQLQAEQQADELDVKRLEIASDKEIALLKIQSAERIAFRKMEVERETARERSAPAA